MILSECGETSTKHSSCLLELKDKQRRAISISGTVTWKKKINLVQLTYVDSCHKLVKIRQQFRVSPKPLSY